MSGFMNFICIILYCIGYGFIISFANWYIAVGIFIIHWASNIESRIKNTKNRVNL